MNSVALCGPRWIGVTNHTERPRSPLLTLFGHAVAVILVLLPTWLPSNAQQLKATATLGFSVTVIGAPRPQTPTAQVLSMTSERGSSRFLVEVPWQTSSGSTATPNREVVAHLRGGSGVTQLTLAPLGVASVSRTGSGIELLELRCSDCAAEDIQNGIIEIDYRQY